MQPPTLPILTPGMPSMHRAMGLGMLSARLDNDIENCSHGIVGNRLSLEALDNKIDSVDFGIQAELPNFGFTNWGERHYDF